VALAIGIASVGTATSVAAQVPVDRPVTFTKDIAPILQRSCQRCHQPDSVAPLSLLTYEQVRPYARAIKQRTGLRNAPWSRGAMPPWFLERNIGIQKVKNDISLSDKEIATIAKWADSGAPEGDRADMPPPLKFRGESEWELGKPDLIVSSPTFIVPAVSSDIGTAFGKTATGLTEDRYVASIEFKEVTRYVAGKAPVGQGTIGSRYVIHHAGISIGQEDDEVGEVSAEEDSVGSRQQLSLTEVARNADVFPEEMGKLLPGPHSALFFDNMHIHSAGVPGSERETRLDLGLHLHPTGYKPKYKVQGLGLSSSVIQVSPEMGNQRIDQYFVTTQPIKLTNFEPHQHAAGVRFCMEAIIGSIHETINCSGYDHNWVRNYQYDENVMPLLPKGTILHSTGYLDNTPQNSNVIDTRNLSRFGNSSVNNMFITFEQAVLLTEEQYQDELAKRREYLARTHEEVIGCPDCWVVPFEKWGQPVEKTVAQAKR